MILPSRRARRWLLVAAGLLLAAVAAYLHYRRVSPERHGGTAYGLAFGIAAAVLVLVLLAFGLRKRAYKSTLGTLDGWLQAHIYLGLLAAVVAFFHASGGSWRDRVATATFVVLLLVVFTGLLGARLYAALPRRLTRVESNLTVAEISEQLNALGRAMARVASGRSPALGRIYRRLLAQAEPPPLAGWRLIFGGGRQAAAGEADVAELLAQVSEEERPALRQLLVLSRQRLELYLRLRAQQRYHNLLQAWLYLHLPLSVVLLVLLAAHVLAAAYYGALAPGGG
ncbi:MAG: hypothetical protein D6696_14495 [Acidobacteria bacterium]|nr:MAG: hypothetical protein D6696_14495 [Acidobacteriota bacterium]